MTRNEIYLLAGAALVLYLVTRPSAQAGAMLGGGPGFVAHVKGSNPMTPGEELGDGYGML